ncbi:MAG: ABC-F family ATP-binding cassette domain-containing protein [Flavobacteriales bacterium]|nr:ABC-F family ATP-binding cassette domain-containing protein [Flavobacteriales bacterium]
MISVENIGISFNGNYLFKKVSFQLKNGTKVGLVGKNGAGKSTLLKLLTGLIEYTDGNLIIPKGYSVGYLKQDLGEQGDNTVRDEAMKAFSEASSAEAEYERITKELETRTDYESAAYSDLIQKISDLGSELEMNGSSQNVGDVDKILIGLGFKQEELDRNIRDFSGGWRMRVELAKILLQAPDALLLDEPTNHLDIESIDWLENYLKNYTGILVLISHDQQFLDAVTDRTIEINGGKIYDFKVSYSNYLTQREELFDLQRAAKVNQDKRVEELERFIDRFRAQATKASSVQNKIKQLEKMERIQVDERVVDSMRMRFPEPPRSGKAIVTMEKVAKSYGDKVILKELNLIVGRGEKIAFVGKNGEGKSTLAKMVVGAVKGTGNIEIGHNVNLGYYAQNQAEELDLEKTVFDTIDDIARGDIRKKIRELLGSFLFKGNDVDKKVKVLSGGEKGRLALCKLLLEPYNFLVLDEPTNHLDIPSKEILKDALVNFKGALLVVSHDREFLRDLTNKVYEFKNQTIKEYAGGINFFLAQRKINQLDDLNEVKKPPSKPSKERANNDYQSKKELDSIIKKANNKVSSTERKILDLENKKSDLEEKMNLGTSSPDVFSQFNKVEAQLLEVMSDWERATEELEVLENKRKLMFS